MRLTCKTGLGYQKTIKLNSTFAVEETLLNKLGQLEDIEEELGIDLITLFEQKHEDSYDLSVEKEEKTIYFCGDSYYGHWNKEQWLNLIKELLAAYRELLVLTKEELEK